MSGSWGKRRSHMDHIRSVKSCERHFIQIEKYVIMNRPGRFAQETKNVFPTKGFAVEMASAKERSSPAFFTMYTVFLAAPRGQLGEMARVEVNQ